MTKTTSEAMMLELAARCEAATGPDRELDAAIWLHLPEQADHAWKHSGDKLAHAHQIAGCSFVPAYTASLDAAMKLVPEGWERIQQEQVRMGDGSIRCWASIDKWPASPRRCATPALALCAAALRARATHKEQS